MPDSVRLAVLAKRLAKVAVPENKLVELAVVEKKLVVVALVPVALTKVKFWRVEEATAKILLKVPRPAVVRALMVRRPLEFMERAETEEVAVPATVVVAR